MSLPAPASRRGDVCRRLAILKPLARLKPFSRQRHCGENRIEERKQSNSPHCESSDEPSGKWIFPANGYCCQRQAHERYGWEYVVQKRRGTHSGHQQKRNVEDSDTCKRDDCGIISSTPGHLQSQVHQSRKRRPPYERVTHEYDSSVLIAAFVPIQRFRTLDQGPRPRRRYVNVRLPDPVNLPAIEMEVQHLSLLTREGTNPRPANPG